jgi:hypothetical protein
MTRGRTRGVLSLNRALFSRETRHESSTEKRFLARCGFSEPDGSCSSFGANTFLATRHSEARRHAARGRRARDASWRRRRELL